MRKHDTTQQRPPIKCANPECDTDITEPNRVGTYSIIMWLATRGPDPRLGGFQCPPQEEIERGNIDAQHFCCSLECLRAIVMECFDTHLIGKHNAQVNQLAQADKEAAERTQKAREAAQDVS